ncbi:MAG: sensor histidine kinase [Rhodanobacter sp.]
MATTRWAMDTIAGWFAVNILVAVMAIFGLNALFIEFAGIWARPPLDDAGLLDQVAAVTRLIEATPVASRPHLADAAHHALYRVAWYPNDTSLPQRADCVANHDSGAREIRQQLEKPATRILMCEHVAGSDVAQSTYALTIELADHSWVQFSAHERIWSLNAGRRDLLHTIFVLVSGLLTAGIASRRLARPMERFARAAERFGADVHAPPMPVAGPAEFRTAIHAFNEMQARIQRFVVDRTDMLAAISHDLRAPLTRMRLRGEFIDDPEQQRKLFRDVDEMQAMVNAALNFFRDDSEEELPTRFNLSELIDTVLDDFRDVGERVSYDGPRNQVYFGRPWALRRAIANIVDNAVKYGGGASVSLSVSSHAIHLSIDDEGAGIPEELHDAVFRPFFRAEPSRNRQTGGVGLGLSSARSTIRGHGGEISLVNRMPKGLTVNVTLPLST